MYIVLDTSILTADKQFRNSFWRLIGTRPKRWGLHVAVPWPVVQEAIANRRRDLAEALAALNTALGGVARQGIPVSAEEIVQALQHEINGYEDWFEGKLKSLRIEVLPADFDHSETVRRAVNRLPPCNANGDGYRDTLNWLTVLRLVEQNEDQDVVWLSNDSDFFPQKDSPQLHQNLIDDLAGLGAEGRVWCRRNLGQAQDLLIDKHQLDAETWGWSTLEERVAELVVAELNETEHILDAVACGLPLYSHAAHALLESATHTDPATVTNLETDTPGQGRVLPFRVKFDAQCRMIQYSRADGEASIGLADDGSQEIVHKALSASGTIRIDGGNHEVTDVVIDEVTGVVDDPDVVRNQWQVRRAEWVQRILESNQLSGQDTAASFAKLVGPQESVARVIGEQLRTQEFAASLAKLVGPQESVIKIFGEQLRTQEFAASLAKLVGPQESVARVIGEQLRTQEFAASLAKLVGPQESVIKIFGEQLRTQNFTASVHDHVEPTNDPATGTAEGPTDANSDDK